MHDDPLPSLANESGINNSHDLANGSMRSLAFIMQAGSTATLCVTYSSRSYVPASNLTADALIVNATSLQGGYEYSYSKALGITFTLTSVDSSSSVGNLVYTIDAANNAGGFYDLSYPGVCGLIPFAVVTGPPQVISSSNFPGFFLASTCPLFPPFSAWSQMTGFSGMSAVWLTG
jgi:hypothetical protein